MSVYDESKTASLAVDAIEANLVGKKFLHARTKYSILASGMSEMGELAQEVMIEQGNSYKGAGVDGIVGEALDVICCLFDLIHKCDPNITEEELAAYTRIKCAKWVSKVQNRKD